MSVDATKLLFEGFLQKRKDSLKIWWVTYWFRLQNTTLFFYTEKNGSASHLRGLYYIYTVQSVREVQRADRKRFVFEIIMTNGKKKVLAAETAALRKEWVGHLWRAMHLSTSWIADSRDTHLELDEHQDRGDGSTLVSSDSDSVGKLLLARRLSAPATSNHVHRWSEASPDCLPEEVGFEEEEEEEEEEEMYQNFTFPQQKSEGDSPEESQWSSELNNTEPRQEGHYDVLPIRKLIRVLEAPGETHENIYDVPLSHRKHNEHQKPTESIYDVPSSLLRKKSADAPEPDDHEEDEAYWRL